MYRLLQKIALGQNILLMANEERPYNVNHHYCTIVLIMIAIIDRCAVVGYLSTDSAVVLNICLMLNVINFFSYADFKKNAYDRKHKTMILCWYYVFYCIGFLISCLDNLYFTVIANVLTVLLPLGLYGIQYGLMQICCRKGRTLNQLKTFAIKFCKLITFIPAFVLFVVNIEFIYDSLFLVILWFLYFFVTMPLIALDEYKGENLYEFAFEMTY